MKRAVLTVAQRTILEELIARHGLIVSTQDVTARLTYATDESKQRFVGQLQQAGWLVRIKNGLYQITDVSSLGVLTLSRYTIAQLLHPESYVSFHAALQHHGLFDQSLNIIASVSFRQKTAVPLQGTTYRYVCTQEPYFFGFAFHSLSGRRVRIAESEKALIDLLQFHRTGAAVDCVLEILRDNHHRLQLTRLVQWALRSPLAVQRALGFLFDQVDLDASTLAANVHASHSVTRLTADSHQYSAKWRLYYDPFFVGQDGSE